MGDAMHVGHYTEGSRTENSAEKPERELRQTQMAQKKLRRAEVYARALRASENVAVQSRSHIYLLFCYGTGTIMGIS
jgi:hypothetical protein